MNETMMKCPKCNCNARREDIHDRLANLAASGAKVVIFSDASTVSRSRKDAYYSCLDCGCAFRAALVGKCEFCDAPEGRVIHCMNCGHWACHQCIRFFDEVETDCPSCRKGVSKVNP